MPRVNTAAKGLSHDAVVRAAIDLVEAGGRQALSMRKLGAQLGVEAMSLYTYFPTKRDLELAMADHVLDGITAPATDDPIDDAVVLTNDIRARLIARPHTMKLFTEEMDLRESAAIQRLFVQGLSVVSRIEADADVVLYRFRSILAFVLGHTLLDIAIRDAGVPQDEIARAERTFVAGVRALLASEVRA